MTTTSTVRRPVDVAPTSELGSFELVRRLPVTTWSLRPNANIPHAVPTRESEQAHRSLGLLAGWFEATPWSQPVQATLASRFDTTALQIPLRTTTAWLGVASDFSAVATVPPPPAWLPSVMANWERAIASAADRPLESASWTLWLFATTQPYGSHSEAVATSHAARLVAKGFGLTQPLVTGSPTNNQSRSTAQRLIASAVDTASYGRWHSAWLSSLADDARTTLDCFRSIASERDRLVQIAAQMRAPRHCVLLAESLIARPRTTVADAATRMELTFRAAQAIVDKFVADGLLRETTGRRRDRIYQCDPIASLHARVTAGAVPAASPASPPDRHP